MKKYFFAVAIIIYGAISYGIGREVGFNTAQAQFRQSLPNLVNIFPPKQKPKTGDILIHGSVDHPCNTVTDLTCIDVWYNGTWVDFGMYATMKYAE